MTKTIELAIWDYDGVIVDSFGVLHECYMHICEELGGKYEPDLVKFRQAYMNARNHLQFLESLGIDREKHGQADVIYKRELAKRETPLFPGIEEVLRKISDCMKMKVLSSNNTPSIVDGLAKNNLLVLFNEVIGNESDGDYFAKAEPMKRIIRGSGCSSDSVIAIGDRTRDFFYAIEAGIPAGNIILVEYGWGYDRQKVKSGGYCLKTRVDNPYRIVNALREIELK